MHEKKKATAANKPINPIQQTTAANEGSGDTQKAEKSAKDANPVENKRNNKKREWWVCKECVLGLAGLLVNVAIAIIAFMVYEQTTNFFNIEKKPYLQISDIVVDSLAVGKPCFVHFKINNLGEHPTKIIGGKTASAVRITVPPFNQIDSVPNDAVSAINKYVIKGSPMDAYVDLGEITNDIRYAVINARYSIMLLGFYEYLNLATGTKARYKFILKLKPNASAVMLNENEDLP
jgi:hypothetical protein